MNVQSWVLSKMGREGTLEDVSSIGISIDHTTFSESCTSNRLYDGLFVMEEILIE